MNFGQILADVYRRTGYQSSPATEVATRIKAFVNETYQELLSEPGMDILTHDRQQILSVADKHRYALGGFTVSARIREIRDATNQIVLMPMSLAEWRSAYPDPSAHSGTPTHFVDLGLGLELNVEDTTYTETTLSGTYPPFGKLYFESSGADVRSVYLRGIDVLGTYREETITLVGTSIVGTANNYRVITEIFTTAANSNDVLIQLGSNQEAATSDTSQVFGYIRNNTVNPYTHNIALAPTPSAALTYHIDFERVVKDMTQDSEIPSLIPDKFHRLLATGARYKEYEKLSQTEKMQASLADYHKGLANLKYWATSLAIGQPNLRGPVSVYKRQYRHLNLP